MTDITPQQLKAEALAKLRRIIPRQADQLRDIDPRLLTYYEGLQDPDLHNISEILGGLAGQALQAAIVLAIVFN